MPTRYRCAEIETFPWEDGARLTYSKASRIAKLLSVKDLRLLTDCRDFRTLDEHALQLCRATRFQGLRELSSARLPAPLARFVERLQNHLKKRSGEIVVVPTELAEVKGQLEAYADAGFLVSDVDLIEGCKKAVPSKEEAVKIEAVGFASRDRTEILQRGLSSYIENGREHGRSVQFLVVDDAPDAAAQQRTREMLEVVERQTGAETRYASREDRRAFADQLAAASGAPADLIHFALLGDEEAQRTSGSCYNSLLLDTVGRCYTVADDDTVCQSAVPPDQHEGLVLTSHYDPTEFWFFRDRQASFEAALTVQQDFLQAHETLLGRSIGTCVSDFESPALLDFEQMRPSFDLRLRFHGGRVLTTSAGIFGDSGVGTTGYLYVSPSSRTRLTQTEQDYLAFVESRQVFRAVIRPTVSEGILCMAGNLGMDNRRLLPPFLPVERGEDGVFGATLRKCFRDGYLGYLPSAVKHDPPHHRTQPLSEFMENARRVRFSEVVRQLVQSCPPVSEPGDDDLALRRLGAYLREISSAGLADFEEALKIHFWKYYSDSFVRAEKGASDPGIPEFYKRYRRQHREISRQALREPGYFVPRDMANMESEKEIRSLVQKRVRMFGRLLEVWPDLVAAAKDLQSRGVRLTREIRG